MKDLVFATNNEHKVTEIRAAIGSRFRIITLREAGIDIDIPEPHDTLEANASEKSLTIHRLTGLDAFGEDTGLEVFALGGEPGVLSARYAGASRDSAANMQLVLSRLQGGSDRRARFRTVISLMFDGIEHQFEGICPGRIADAPRGSSGFGYDPVFIPDGEVRTFGEMTMPEKQQFSHRQKATEKLINFLSNA